MKQDLLFTQKRIVAQRTIEIKTQIHGFDCEVETPVELLTPYGEESGHIKFNEPEPVKLLISNSTQQNMLTSSELLNSTENADLYLVVFEDNVFPRNTRVKVFMQGNKYRQLQIRDNIKNEGTFVIHQELVPCNNTVDTTDPNIGLNISVEETKGIGNNL